jgi:tyrosine-protein phosphatase SIW14
MNIRNIRRVLLTLLMLLAIGSAPGVERLQPYVTAVHAAEAPIERFSQISPTLYRGAQPDRAGFTFLRDIGIRTVISLRNDASERALVESLGMRFVHIPVTFRMFGGDMPKQAAERFLSVVDDPAGGLVFVHCKRGADRTGAFVGLYRVVRQGWKVEQAYEEARDIGMRWWYPAVKDQLTELASALAGGKKQGS